MSKKVEIAIVHDRCIYINDYRVAGNKPYSSENIKTTNYFVDTKKILDQLDFEDIKKYVEEKENNE